MADRKLGGLFVEVIAKGMQAVQAQIDKLRTKVQQVSATKLLISVPQVAAGAVFTGFNASVGKAQEGIKKLGDQINTIGPIASRSFAAGSAAISGFIRAADPVGVEQFKGTLGQIAVQLGSIFLPIMDAARARLESFLAFLRSLDSAQKDQIVQWTKIAGAVALVVAVLPKLVGAIQAATAVMKAFGVASALATGGLTAILALVGAGVAGFVLLGDKADGSTGAVGGFLGTLAGMAEKILNALQPVFAALADLGANLLDAIKPVLPALADLAATLVKALVPVVQVIGSFAGQLVEVLGELVKALVPVVQVFTEVAGQIVTALVPVVQAVAEVAGQIVEALAGILQQLAPVLADLAKLIGEALVALMPVVTTVVEVIGSLLESLQPVITALTEAFLTAVSAIITTVSSLLTALQPVFTMLGELIAEFGDIFAEVMVALTPLIELFREVVQSLAPIFETVFGFIAEAVKALQPVFETVFSAIRFVIMGVAKALVFVTTLIRELARGNIRGSVTEALQAVEDFERRMEERRQERERKRAEAKKKQTKQTEQPEKTAPAKPPEGRHSPTAGQKVELTGFAELWRKAQQATVETAEMKMEQERNRLAQQQLDENKRQTKLLEKIADDGSQSFGFSA